MLCDQPGFSPSLPVFWWRISAHYCGILWVARSPQQSLSTNCLSPRPSMHLLNYSAEMRAPKEAARSKFTKRTQIKEAFCKKNTCPGPCTINVPGDTTPRAPKDFASAPWMSQAVGGGAHVVTNSPPDLCLSKGRLENASVHFHWRRAFSPPHESRLWSMGWCGAAPKEVLAPKTTEQTINDTRYTGSKSAKMRALVGILFSFPS